MLEQSEIDHIIDQKQHRPLTEEERKKLLKHAIDSLERVNEILDGIDKRCTKRMQERAFERARVM